MSEKTTELRPTLNQHQSIIQQNIAETIGHNEELK